LVPIFGGFFKNQTFKEPVENKRLAIAFGLELWFNVSLTPLQLRNGGG